MHRILDSSLIFSTEKIEDLFLEIDTSIEPLIDTKDSMFSDLIEKQSCAFVTRIKHIPKNKPEDSWVIAALAPRKKSTINAWFKKTTSSKGNALWIKPNALVHADSDVLMEQIKMWQPLIREASLEDAEVVFYHEGKYDLEGDVLSLSQSELVPDTSTGIWAIVVLKDDLELRHHLAQLHHVPTGLVNNLERRAVAEVGKRFDNLSIHCVQDKLGRYHLHAFTQSDLGNQKYHLIQNSWVGLVDNFLLEIDKKEC